MRIRICLTALAALSGALPAWPAKLGEPAPDLTVRDARGAELRLSEVRDNRIVVLLAEGPAGRLPVAVIEDACRRLEPLKAVALALPSDVEKNDRLSEVAAPATVLIDPDGVMRRIEPGRALTGDELERFVKLWQFGKVVFNASCARCHGEDGALHICEDVKPLVGIGNRLTAPQIRERLRIGEVNDKEVLIRGEFYKRPEVDAVIAYISGL
ncbi:MAG: hypothetical protein KIT09_21170 [Bryobacteraceae bacterium]|nr:hypothetical protein [Bryobacteraceae bacterium]